MARLLAIIALVRESRGSWLLLLLLVVVGPGRRGGWWGLTLFIEEAFLRVLGLGGAGAGFRDGLRGSSSALAAGPVSSLAGDLDRGDRVEDADTKVSLDEFEPMDARRPMTDPPIFARSSFDCTAWTCEPEADEEEIWGFCSGGLGDCFGFTAAFELPAAALGRTAGGCRFGFGPSLFGSGERISVAARRIIWGGGVLARSGGTGLNVGFGPDDAPFPSRPSLLT